MTDNALPSVSCTVRCEVRTDSVLINCRNPHGGDTYVARARTVRAQASSTMGRRVAVEKCAEKIYGPDGFKLHQYTVETWLASPNVTDQARGSRAKENA